jgi:hypothetical protein
LSKKKKPKRERKAKVTRRVIRNLLPTMSGRLVTEL